MSFVPGSSYRRSAEEEEVYFSLNKTIAPEL
jgi:hypothetical protein